MRRKEKISDLIIVVMLVIISFSTIMFFLNKYEYYRYNKQVGIVISNISSELEKKYGEEVEEKIIQILNSPDLKYNGEILDKYSINSAEVITSINKITIQNLIINIIYIILLAATLVTIFIIYLKERDRDLKEITKYLKEINKKNYSLDISENTEGELSILKNELYKMTVMLKEQAENAKNDKSNLMMSLEDISHQLKTPLTAIDIMLDNLIENEDMDKETRKDFINDIYKQASSMNFLILTLLKLSKLDAGAINFKKEEINIDNLIKDILSNLNILIEIKNINIIVKGDKDITFIGDYKWESEAISNIIKNCIEHSNNDSNIYITYDTNNIDTKITIRDEGKGISKEDLKNIFKRFYKGKNSSEDSYGIGLSLAKNIIEHDNGFIKVYSKLNEGSTFEIKYIK